MINLGIENRLKLCLDIKNHPVSQLPGEIKDKYLVGLGAVLSKVSVSSSVLHNIYDRWCISIAGHTYDAFFPHRQHAKDALTLNRIGLRMFRMSYEFFFDCFYLVELFNPDMTGNVHYYLHDHICGRSTKGALQNVRLLFWKEIQHPSIPKELIAHREANKKFLQSPAKRVLVVANMSAGKSTLINAITGYRVNAVANTACTSKLKYIFNKPIEDGGSFWESNGKTLSQQPMDKELYDKNCEALAFHFNSLLKNENVSFIDTPGVNNSKDSSHEQITYDAIKSNDYDVVLLVADGRYPGTTDEKNLINYLKANTTKPIIVAVNQLDVYDPEQDSMEKILATYHCIMQDVGISDSTIIPVSGWLALMDKIPDEQQESREVRNEKHAKQFFMDDFFDLQRYVTHHPAEKIIDRTGIPLLEQVIGLTINKQNNQ